MRSLSNKIFQFNQDDIQSVELELRAGNLGGRESGGYDTDEIASMHESGLFMRRYRKYIESKTFSPQVIEHNLNAWYDEFKDDYDDECGEQLFYPDMRQRVDDAISHVDDIYDVDSEHYTKRRLKPRQRHRLHEKVCDRGEKVEIFHSMQGDYSNTGCRATLAQAQTMEGAMMFTMDKQQEALYHEHKASSPTVPHYRPWLRLEANSLARRAGMALPHPDEIEPRPDNGERFLYDYYVEQRARERESDFSDEAMVRCPCRRCVERRRHCKCDACAAARGVAGSANPTGILGLIAQDPHAAEKFDAAANLFARRAGPQDARRARQARHVATVIRSNFAELAIQHSQMEGWLLDMEAILQPTAPTPTSPSPTPTHEHDTRHSASKRKATLQQPDDDSVTLARAQDADDASAPMVAPMVPEVAAAAQRPRARSRSRDLKNCPYKCDCGAALAAQVRQAEERGTVVDMRDARRSRARCSAWCQRSMWKRGELDNSITL